jgi:V/A-type H+-transporting ATPase subunit I
MNHEERVRISEQLPNLLRAREYLHWLNQKQAAREAIKESKRTVTIFGWVPKNMVSVLEKKLQKLSPSYAVVSVKPEAEESSPVLLRNSTIITPFESVTTLYGLPLSTEFDPTILLAGFFILFFGLCLTDAGYGLVLAAITGGYLLKKKLPIRKAPLWWLLFFGGIATFLISIPFGGWFGMTAAQAPSWMTVDTNGDGVADLFKGQVWNLGETKGITFFQNLALALGLAHLSFGMFLAGYAKWRDGRFAEAFWVDFTSLILIASAIAYFLGPQDFKQYSLYAIYASIVLMIWGKGYGSPFASRLFKGILGMLNFALGMTSNVLSYLRLLALGLVTGALALAVNLVAQQIGGLLPPIIGVPLSIVILIVGHTINIALNVLGAFIHSGRLQFVEFFSQFFEGGGRPFQPFSRSRTV